MNIFSRLPRRKPVLPQPGPSAVSGDGGVTDEPPSGCGWFDSSHELRRGLLVQEHASPDALACELPLASWLELHLSGWRPASPA
jgi:hypothetical protein